MDFGGILHRRPETVVLPRTPGEVALVVRTAREARLAVTVRSTGHSVWGQTLADQGVVLSMERLTGVEAQGGETYSALAGTRWREVLTALGFPRRQMAVVTGSPGQSIQVGGTLSMGGYGWASHLRGGAYRHVRSIEIVDGRGELVRASREENPEVFRHALAGLGQIGILVRAELRSVPSEPWMRGRALLYRDPERWFRDLVSGSGDPGLEGHVGVILPPGRMPNPVGARPLFGIFELALVRRPWRRVGWPTGFRPAFELPFLTSTRRGILSMIPWRPAYLARRHPWVEGSIPAVGSLDFLLENYAGLEERGLLRYQHEHGILVIPFASDASDPFPASVEIPGSELSFLTGQGLAIPPGADSLDRVRDYAREFTARLLERGGRRYPCGILDLSPIDWRRQFGAALEPWKRLKKEHDPDGILNPFAYPGLFPGDD